VRACFTIKPFQAWYYRIFQTFAPWWFCYKSTPLLTMNLKLFVKVITKLKTFLSLHGLQFLTLDIIVGCMVRFVNYLLITRQTV
jgi:hypothetical protein